MVYSDKGLAAGEARTIAARMNAVAAGRYRIEVENDPAASDGAILTYAFNGTDSKTGVLARLFVPETSVVVGMDAANGWDLRYVNKGGQSLKTQVFARTGEHQDAFVKVLKQSMWNIGNMVDVGQEVPVLDCSGLG